MKYTRTTQISFVLVIVIFLMQAFLLYRLYQTDLNLLQRELNMVIDEVYQAELNMRLEKDSPDMEPIKYLGNEMPSGYDSTEIIKFEIDQPLNEDMSTLSLLNMAVEEYMSISLPLNIQNLDSIASVTLIRNKMNLDFYSEVIDLEKNHVLNTSLETQKHPFNTLASKDIYLNTHKTKALRIILINPMFKVYVRMSLTLLLSIGLCLICIYIFHSHWRTLSKQRQLAQIKNDLFADLSHELQKPLAIMYQVVSLLENEKVILDKDRRNRYLKVGESEIKKMSEQTEMILSMAMNEEGVLELHFAEFDLEEMVSEIVDKYMYTATSTLNIDIKSTMELSRVYADRNHMEHVLSNLISNSTKYSNPPIQIDITLSEDNNNVLISVKDNGIGITKSEQIHIFDKFYRGEKTNNSIKGHGIGLSYVKKITERHKGSISLKSEPDKGSEFIIKLPRLKVKN